MDLATGLGADTGSGCVDRDGTLGVQPRVQLTSALQALRELVTVGLRDALDEDSREPSLADVLDRVQLRRALNQVCVAAHQQGLRAEQLIILLKQVWSTPPDTGPSWLTRHRNEMLSHIVGLCIDDFYGSVASEGSIEDPNAQRAD